MRRTEAAAFFVRLHGTNECLVLPEEGWRGREIFGLAKEESRVKGLGNGYF